MMTTTTDFICRPLKDERDWWRIRDLLIETFPMTGPGFNWEIRRWDGSRYHNDGALLPAAGFYDCQVWETRDGRLAGAVLREGDSEASFQIHPEFRAQLEEEMLAWAEAHLTGLDSNGRRQLEVSVYEYDAPRRRLLAKHGFEQQTYGWITRRMHLGRWPLPAPVIAEGYCMRTTNPDDPQDYQRIADVLNAGFNRPGFHQPGEIANFFLHAPSFRHDLDLVAEAPDGSFAAYSGLTIDWANRYAIFEPVCTHPDHRRRRLAQTLMREGLRRLQLLGVQEVEVSTGDADAANGLYDSIGFTEYYKAYNWLKRFE